MARSYDKRRKALKKERGEGGRRKKTGFWELKWIVKRKPRRLTQKKGHRPDRVWSALVPVWFSG